MAFGSVIRLHILKLPMSSISFDYDFMFKTRWIIDDDSKDIVPGFRASEGAKVQNGDLIFFPELQTGAGEFEGLRYAGECKNEKLLPLLMSDIESAAFPREIAVMAKESHYTLRQLYEAPLQYILELDGEFSLSDIYGGEEVVEDFWSNPDIINNKEEMQDTFLIPMSQCGLVETKEWNIESK